MNKRRHAIATALVKQYVTGGNITWKEVETAIKAMKEVKS